MINILLFSGNYKEKMKKFGIDEPLFYAPAYAAPRNIRLRDRYKRGVLNGECFR